MENIPLPNKINYEDLGNNKYRVVMEPLYPGYGVTIGNSMRRVLLSSLPGAAVVAVKIKGVDHEFTTVPNVKEDAVELILNLKQLRMKIHTDQPVKLELKAKGEKIVTAADFKKNSDVDIINQDLVIATLDNKAADFEMELTVQTGRGYVPVELREHEKLEIGNIAVDAIYTPMRNVNYDIEHVRVGQITNYDKLTLNLETDGTITGKEAIETAAKVLTSHYGLFLEVGEEAISENVPSETLETSSSDNSENAPVLVENEKALEVDDLQVLGLSNRSYNALIKNGISKATQLKGMTEEQLNDLEGLGDKSITEILEAIKKL
jgi:DNA-directed RNA polymerase subunit alpha